MCVIIIAKCGNQSMQYLQQLHGQRGFWIACSIQLISNYDLTGYVNAICVIGVQRFMNSHTSVICSLFWQRKGIWAHEWYSHRCRYENIKTSFERMTIFFPRLRASSPENAFNGNSCVCFQRTVKNNNNNRTKQNKT